MPEAVPATSLCLQNNPLLGIITPILFILLLLFFKGYLAHRFQCMALHHAVSCLLFFFFNLFLFKTTQTYFIYLFLAALGLRSSVRGISPVAASGGHSSSRCVGLSLSRPLPLRSTGSRRAGSVAVAHGLSFRGMWDPPRPGLEPVSPALAGRLLTTAPPGKPLLPPF